MTDDSQLLMPWSGELVQLTEPESCVRALAEIRELEAKLREAKSELSFHLAQEFQRQGLKTMTFEDGTKAELKGGSGISWDVEILEELLGLGLPQERFDKLVTPTIEYRVNTAEAKRIATANPAYGEVIERARSTYSKPAYISLKS